MSDRYTQYIKITSTDGKNVVESVINDINKRIQKGQVEFGIDVDMEKVDKSEIEELEGGFE